MCMGHEPDLVSPRQECTGCAGVRVCQMCAACQSGREVFGLLYRAGTVRPLSVRAAVCLQHKPLLDVGMIRGLTAHVLV